MKIKRFYGCFWIVIATLLGTFQGIPAGLSSADLDQLVNDFLARQATQVLPASLTMKDAHKIQSQFVKRLTKNLEKTVGYKVGLVTQKTQAKLMIFRGPQTIRQKLLSWMLIEGNGNFNRADAYREIQNGYRKNGQQAIRRYKLAKALIAYQFSRKTGTQFELFTKLNP